MAKVTCYIYPEVADADKFELVQFLSEGCGWENQQTVTKLRSGGDITIDGLSKAEARKIARACAKFGVFASVGPLDEKWRRKLQPFNSGFRLSWNWCAFLFHWLWYLFKGFFQKLVLYAVIWNVIAKIFPAFGWVAGLAFMIYAGLMGNYDRYLKHCAGEIFWPKLPYHKVKFPFWILVVLIIGWGFYGAGKGAMDLGKTAIYMQEQLSQVNSGNPFESDDFRFNRVPPAWTAFRNTPEDFTLNITRQTGPNSTESLAIEAIEGMQFISTIQEVSSQAAKTNDPEQGLVAVVVPKSKNQGSFTDLREPELLKIAEKISGQIDVPFFLKFVKKWFPQEALPPAYYQIHGRPWAYRAAKMGIRIAKVKADFFMDTYWTVLNGRVVFVVARYYGDTRDSATRQVRRFIESFEPTQVNDPEELGMISEGLTMTQVKTSMMPPSMMQQTPTPAPANPSPQKVEAPKKETSPQPKVASVPKEAPKAPSSISAGRTYKMILTSGKKAEGLVTKTKSDGFWLELEPGASVFIRYDEVQSIQ